MQVACSTSWAKKVPLREAIEAIAGAGFSAVDLVVPAGTIAGELHQWLDDHALLCAGVAIRGALDEPLARQSATLARELGLSSFSAWAGLRHEQSLEGFADQVRFLLDGIDSCEVEFINLCRSRLEQPEDFLELFIRVPDARLWAAVDTLEYHRASVDPRAAVQQLADRCRRIRLADAIADRYALLGDGEINVRSVLEAIRRTGSVDWLVLNPAVSQDSRAVDELIAERRRLESLLES